MIQACIMLVASVNINGIYIRLYIVTVGPFVIIPKHQAAHLL